MFNILGKIRSRLRSISGKTNPYQSAVTDAVPGQPSHAEAAFSEPDAAETMGRLVVMGRESVFSGDIIEYAIDMAERMSYEIIALNAAPLSCETFRLSSSRDQICTDFQMLSEQNVAPFRKAAQDKAIPFLHVVKFSDSHAVLKELRKEIGGFEFVISEEDPEVATERAENSERPCQEIFVYSML